MPGLKAWLRRQLARRGGLHPGQSARRVPARGTGLAASAEDNNEFSLAAFEQLRHSPGNLFFSPFSVRTVLAMACSGARGETAAQMSRVLRIRLSGDGPEGSLSDLLGHLSATDHGRYEMRAASSLWTQVGEPLLPGFLDLIAREYRGATRQADFRHDAEAARRAINRWVATETHQKILDLIPRGGLTAETSLALVNALYFRGLWASRFERALTEEEDFELGGPGRVKVPLMRQEARVFYQDAEGFQAVDLVYSGGDLSMLVLLPRRKNGLPDLEKGLSASRLRECVARMVAEPVRIFLPRFRFTWGTVDLGPHLATLGMPLAFTPGLADFSGMNGRVPPSKESLHLSAVFHQAHLEVTEEGTEATAATALLVAPTASRFDLSRPARVRVFRADHPFLFAIRDRRSGSILFLGRVSDPTR